MLFRSNAGKVFLNPETGELLLGDEVAEKIQALGDTETIEYSYRKSDWQKGDLRPEHYFECTSYTEVNGTAKAIEYNKGKDISDQEITYDIGFNQKLKVNTLASDVFTHDLGRDIDEIIKANQDVIDMEEMIVKLESELKNASEDDKATVQARLDAANKACDLLKDKCQKAFESGITKMQKHLDKVTLAITSVGNTGNRLDMVENRLQAQQTNFKQLASDNEGVDLTELAVQLSSAELSLEAALLATGKITQNSLMNFI